MVARADVVREFLKKNIPYHTGNPASILLSPEVWALILGCVGVVGNLLMFSKEPAFRKAGKHIVYAVRYVRDAAGNLVPVEQVPPVVRVDKRRLLLQIQATQSKLDALGKDVDPATRARLQTTIDTLLDVLAKDMKGTDA